MSSESQESMIRSQAILMMARNYNRPHVIKRILRRFKKCLERLI